MKTNDYLGKEGYALMGAAFEVYNENGHGMGEEIYQESLEIELNLRKIPFRSKDELQVFYKGFVLKKTYIPDLMVYREIITELKSVKALLPEHEAQLINYMRITKKAVGYLINFGTPNDLQWKRFIIKEFIPKEWKQV
ncbi:MAG: GxxExxY protein [Kiritimatiellae bacterium]|jgi:GxxExxY protein|nr:GxxExxY protein [Kiritimatiellia bacterium]